MHKDSVKALEQHAQRILRNKRDHESYFEYLHDEKSTENDQRNVAAQYTKHASKGRRPFVYLFSAPCTRTLKNQHKNLKKSV